MIEGQTNEKKKNINWFVLILTFMVALVGSYLSQIYLTNIWGTDNISEAQRLSYNKYEDIVIEESPKSESVIEEAMKSVVGISKLQANEESILDISLSQKWGMRNGNYSIRKWVHFNKSTFGW